jgi:hypothetical protein
MLAMSPDGVLAACTDDKGRVVLVDSISKTILRSWKGYRDAQVGWVRQLGKPTGSRVRVRPQGSNQDSVETDCKRRCVAIRNTAP